VSRCGKEMTAIAPKPGRSKSSNRKKKRRWTKPNPNLIQRLKTVAGDPLHEAFAATVKLTPASEGSADAHSLSAIARLPEPETRIPINAKANGKRLPACLEKMWDTPQRLSAGGIPTN